VRVVGLGKGSGDNVWLRFEKLEKTSSSPSGVD
jgi:hypothetical protein